MANDINKQVLEELKEIKKDIHFIKEHMNDIDSILTPEEEERLNESLEDLKEGRTTSLDDFDREMKKNVQHRTK